MLLLILCRDKRKWVKTPEWKTFIHLYVVSQDFFSIKFRLIKMVENKEKSNLSTHELGIKSTHKTRDQILNVFFTRNRKNNLSLGVKLNPTWFLFLSYQMTVVGSVNWNHFFFANELKSGNCRINKILQRSVKWKHEKKTNQNRLILNRQKLK